jgi:hypothetical protein
LEEALDLSYDRLLNEWIIRHTHTHTHTHKHIVQ